MNANYRRNVIELFQDKDEDGQELHIYRGRRISGRLRNPYVHMESLPCVGNKFVSFVFRSVFAAPETPTSVCFKEALR